MPRTVHRTCHLCEAMCGLRLEVEGERILSVRGDPQDAFSRGHICPKGVAIQDLHTDPDRLRAPMRREGDHWVEISWEEALDEAARRLAAVQSAHGREAVAVYAGNPTVHNAGSLLYAPLLLRALGTPNRFSATSVDQLPAMLAGLLMFGHQLLIPVPDLDRARHLLILGANPAVSNGSLMTAGDVVGRLKGIRERGGRIVLLDPRRTETAKLADEHHFVRPGSDALVLLALVHVLFAEDRVRPGRLSPMLEGLEEVRRAAEDFPPERVAAATGLAAETIRRLARELADQGGVVYGRIGVSTQPFGGLCLWLINVLNALTGALDREGGAMFPLPAVDLVAITARTGRRGRFATRRTRVRGLPNFGGEFPAAALAEEMDTPGEGQLRGLVTFAGNPVLSTPNGARLERALPGLDFYLAIDPHLNETTRHAHLILPPASHLEQDHYDLAFHLLQVRNTAKWSPAVFPKSPGSMPDWEILLELARRVARRRGGGLRARLRFALLRRLGPRGMIDLALRTGPYGGLRGLSVRKLARAEHGIDLGALKPALPARLYTPDRRIRLAPPEFLADLPRLAAWATQPPARLVLVGRRQLRSNNSWMHNAERLVRGADPCTLIMHPEDAKARNLSEGQRVRLRSAAGAVEVPLAVDDGIMPGVVSLPHGWGHGRPGIRLRVAAAHPGASLNDVTEEGRVDTLSGNAAFSATPVEVEAA